MVDQIVTQREIEAAGVLLCVHGIGVVGDDVGAARLRFDVEVAAKAILPAGVANKLERAIGVDEEAGGNFIMRSGARLKVVVGSDRNEGLPHLFKRGALEDLVVFRLASRIGRLAEQEAKILEHVTDGSVEAAVGAGDAGVEIEGIFGELAVFQIPAVGAVFEQEIGAAIVVSMAHAERAENVLFHVDGEGVSGEALDDLAEEDDAEIGVAEARAWLEGYVCVGKHGNDLRPLRGLEGLPRFVVVMPGPRSITKAAGMSHDMTDSDLINGSEAIVSGSQLGQVFHQRVIEREQAAIAKLHDGDTRECLGAGGPVIGGVCVDGRLRRLCLYSVVVAKDNFTVVEDGEAAAEDSIGAEAIFIPGANRRSVLQRALPGARCSDGTKG